jgi:hypothetical protein
MGISVQSVKSGNKVPVGAGSKRKFPSPLDKAKGYEVVWQQVSSVFESARGVGGVTFVYFIGESDDGSLKIGTSKDPISRLRGMQTGNPRRLRIEHVLVGSSYLEKLLHEIWESFAIFSAHAASRTESAPGTEWFKPEIRETLLPVVVTAAEAQVAYIREHRDVIDEADMERILREAHGAHDVVAHKREERRVFGPDGAGIASRHSRI